MRKFIDLYVIDQSLYKKVEKSLTWCRLRTHRVVKELGEQLLLSVNRAGAHEKTQVHCVGDGAVWIANQVAEHFGARGTYLIDFYHLCEYLAEAAPACAPNDEVAWLNTQKERRRRALTQHG